VNPDRANVMNDKSTMNKILEYMALSKPMVQFNLTEGRFSAAGASLYARHNDTKDFALKLCSLLDDEPLRRRMGEIGRRRVEGELAWQHQVPKLLAAYDMAFAVTAAPALLGPDDELDEEGGPETGRRL
jgi:glycosyltransferase involved in cell wall biosynthesis